MKKFVFAAVLITSAAHAHQNGLRNRQILSMSGQDYDLAFKLERSCEKAGVRADECAKFLGLGNDERSEALKSCVSQEYVPLADFAKVETGKAKARGHITVEEDKEFGKHFYTVDDSITKAAVSAYEAKLIKERARLLRAKNSKAVLSKADWTDIEREKERAKNDPLLGGYEPDLICSEKMALCVGATSAKVLSPLWKGSPPKTTKGFEIGRQLKPEISVTEYKERLEKCLSSKFK
jgi:hypothetical protein